MTEWSISNNPWIQYQARTLGIRACRKGIC